MGNYFIIQLKRLLKLIPILLLVIALLLGGIYLAYQEMLSQWEQGQLFQKIQIGVIGTGDDALLQKAVDAVKSMDSSKMSLEFIQMEKQQAADALEKGQISAYMEIPDDFLNEALRGNILTVKYVSSAGSENILSLVKDEFTYVLANMLLQSEQGAYALELVLDEYGHSDIAWEQMNALALEYAGAILHRDDVYRVEEIGTADGMSFGKYLLLGLFTLFIFLLTLPFCTVWIQDKLTTQLLLKAKGLHEYMQVLCEFGAYFLLLLIITVPVYGLLPDVSLGNIGYMLPAVFLIASLSYLVYGLVRDLISGVLLQLVLSMGMCFICGCMYPVYFFPVSVQKLAAYLPAAVARNCLDSGNTQHSCWLAWAMGTVFLLISLGNRIWRLNRRGEDKR